MKAYLVTTAIVFVLLVFAHVARVWVEGAWVFRDPFFVASTLIALGLAGWALALLRRAR